MLDRKNIHKVNPTVGEEDRNLRILHGLPKSLRQALDALVNFCLFSGNWVVIKFLSRSVDCSIAFA
jgi:hypothetical protein